MQSDPKYYLEKVAAGDTQEFLKVEGNWDNHRPLLLLALSLTGGDVFEFGAGDGSTPYLRKYCEANNRRFRSFESNEVWAIKCGSEFIKNWDDDMLYRPCSVAFVDHAPGEHRHIAVKRLAEFVDIIVAHDAELYGAGNYQYDKVVPLFKYKLGYNLTSGGAGCIALSNKIDLEKFKGLKLGNHQFDL